MTLSLARPCGCEGVPALASKPRLFESPTHPHLVHSWFGVREAHRGTGSLLALARLRVGRPCPMGRPRTEMASPWVPRVRTQTPSLPLGAAGAGAGPAAGAAEGTGAGAGRCPGAAGERRAAAAAGAGRAEGPAAGLRAPGGAAGAGEVCGAPGPHLPLGVDGPQAPLGRPHLCLLTAELPDMAGGVGQGMGKGCAENVSVSRVPHVPGLGSAPQGTQNLGPVVVHPQGCRASPPLLRPVALLPEPHVHPSTGSQISQGRRPSVALLRPSLALLQSWPGPRGDPALRPWASGSIQTPWLHHLWDSAQPLPASQTLSCPSSGYVSSLLKLKYDCESWCSSASSDNCVHL